MGPLSIPRSPEFFHSFGAGKVFFSKWSFMIPPIFLMATFSEKYGNPNRFKGIKKKYHS
jgi:hypothetical protein